MRYNRAANVKIDSCYSAIFIKHIWIGENIEMLLIMDIINLAFQKNWTTHRCDLNLILTSRELMKDWVKFFILNFYCCQEFDTPFYSPFYCRLPWAIINVRETFSIQWVWSTIEKWWSCSFDSGFCLSWARRLSEMFGGELRDSSSLFMSHTHWSNSISHA